jgi:hypothetical protein
MPIDIPLRFETHFDPQLLAEGVQIDVVRLITEIDFKTSSGWSKKYQAIIDIGSPFNIIPGFIWSATTNHLILAKQLYLDGIGPGSVPGYLGEVTMRVSYSNKSSGPLKMKAFLLESDSAPLILGFEDFLSAGILYSNYPQNSAGITI